MNKNQFVKITSRILVFFILLLVSSPMLSCGGGDRFGDNGNSDPENSQNEDPNGDDSDYANNVFGYIDTVDIDVNNFTTDGFATVWDINNNLEYDEEDSSFRIKTHYIDISSSKQMSINVSLTEYNLFRVNQSYDYVTVDSFSGSILVIDSESIQTGLKNTVPYQTTEYAITSVMLYIDAISFSEEGSFWQGTMDIVLDGDAGSLTINFSTSIQFQSIEIY